MHTTDKTHLEVGTLQQINNSALQSQIETLTEADLLYGVDGDTCRTGYNEMAVLNVRPNLIQDKGYDVGFHRQEEHIALIDGLFVASRQVHPHFLQKQKKQRIAGDEESSEGGKQVFLQQHAHVLPLLDKPTLAQVLEQTFSFQFPSRNKVETCLLTLSPDTVGRSVSGELAVILCVAITPEEGDRRK